jgi:hypothetical protein
MKPSLLIDDLRRMEVDCTVRTFDQGMKMLELGGWGTLYIDHDLGENEDNLNGYALINYLIDLDMAAGENRTADKIVIVSSNPVGRENIERALLHSGWRKYGGFYIC